MNEMTNVETPEVDAELAALLADDSVETEDEIIEEAAPTDDDELTAVLETVEPEAKAEPEEIPEEAVADAVGELEAAEAREEIYAEQESTEKEAKPQPEPKKSKAKKSSGRVTLSGYARTSEAIRDMLGEKLTDYMVFEASDADAADLKALAEERLEMIDKLAVKERAKVANIFKHLVYGSRLEGYVAKAIKVLANDGEISAKSMREALLAHPYSPGTANAQTNQIMHILPALKIVKSEEGVFKANEDSTLFEALKAAA